MAGSPNSQGKSAGAIPVYMAGSANGGVTPVVGNGLVSGLVAKASPGVALSAMASIPSGVAACWLVGYNAIAVPSDGAVSAALIFAAVPLAAGPAFASIYDPIPDLCSVGIVYYLTSGANPYANKVGVNGFIKAKVA